MNTFTQLAEHFRRLADNSDRTNNKDVEATAAQAARVFRCYQKNGMFSWYQCSPDVWDIPPGRTVNYWLALCWRGICGSVCRRSDELVGDSYSIGAADVEQETRGPGVRTGVIGFSDSRHIQRAAEYAGICDVLAQEAGEAATASDAAPAADEGGERIEGEWLTPPISLADMGNRLGNVGTKKARSILRPFGLKQAGNRQLWTVRVDNMGKNMRAKLEGKPQNL